MTEDKGSSNSPPDSTKNVTRKYSALEALGLSGGKPSNARDSHGQSRQRASLTTTLASYDSPTDFREISDTQFKDYITVPSDHRTTALAKTRTWHVLLISQELKHPPLALRIMGDIVLGRKVEGVNPDIDLNPYEPGLHGVSRTHAMIRPTQDQLLLIDLGSTNGTLLNGMKLKSGRTGNVTDKSVISLGKLHFKVSIMRCPGDNMG